jgi:hypothetical protein
MEKRSESDIVKKTLTLAFGEKEYEIPVLRMLQAAKWRKEYFQKVQQIRDGMKVEDEGVTPAQLSKAISNTLVGSMLAHVEQIPEIVFSYAPTLPREEIMESAYDEQFALAFKQIWQVTFQPFLGSLGLALEMSKLSESRLAS